MTKETPQSEELGSSRPSQPRAYTIAELRGIVKPLPGRESLDFDEILELEMQAWAEREMRIVSGQLPDED